MNLVFGLTLLGAMVGCCLLDKVYMLGWLMVWLG